MWKLAANPSALAIDWPGLKDSPVDPYLIWFDYVGLDLVGPENFKSWYAGKLPLLLELHDAFDGSVDSKAEVPAIYKLPLGRLGPSAHFVSARVAPGDLATLFANKRIKRFQLELSRIRNTETKVAATPRKAEPGTPLPRTAMPQTWLGVIDMGCAFAHQNFRSESPDNPGAVATRVRYLWDQSPTREALKNKWGVATGLGYGAELGPAEFDLAMADFRSEEASYAQVGCESVLEMRAQHGFGVLDLAAGRPSPLVVGPPPLEGDPDAAGALPVVFVQLDSIEDRVTNINSLGVHVLDGLRWMIDRVEHDRGGDPEAKLVVNISYGGLAGPHDGSSILERAIDELIATRKNLFVVVAAGNSHDPDLPTHALLKVKKDQPGTALWQVEPDDPTDGFLELWFPAKLSVVDHGVRIRVTAPDGSTTEDIQPNQTWMLPASDATGAGFAAGAMFRSHAANGEDSAMFLLAVQPTATGGGALRAAQAGLWKVEVACQSGKEIKVHAWLERDDYVSGNLKRKQQSALIDPGDKSVSLEYGLSSLAHGKHTIVAGGYCLSDGGVSEDTASGPGRCAGARRGPDVSAPSDESRNTPGLLVAGATTGIVNGIVAGGWCLSDGGDSEDTASGPGRCAGARRGPDVSAPSDESRATPGLLVAGATTGIVNRMSGTSAAAPSVARWIANWCAAVPGAVDIKMLRDAIGWLPGRELVRGPPPGPEVVPGTVDEVCRLSRVRIDARLEPTLPLPGAVALPP